MLMIAQDTLGSTWLKHIVVEGYADQRGDYLLNLNLSLHAQPARAMRAAGAPLLPKLIC